MPYTQDSSLGWYDVPDLALPYQGTGECGFCGATSLLYLDEETNNHVEFCNCDHMLKVADLRNDVRILEGQLHLARLKLARELNKET